MRSILAKIKCLESSGSASTKLLPGPLLGTLAYTKPQSWKQRESLGSIVYALVQESPYGKTGLLFQRIFTFHLMLHLESNV